MKYLLPLFLLACGRPSDNNTSNVNIDFECCEKEEKAVIVDCWWDPVLCCTRCLYVHKDYEYELCRNNGKTNW